MNAKKFFILTCLIFGSTVMIAWCSARESIQPDSWSTYQNNEAPQSEVIDNTPISTWQSETTSALNVPSNNLTTKDTWPSQPASQEKPQQNLPETTTTTTTTNESTTYTVSDIASHDSASSCRSIVNSIVYDLTKYINKHPNGPQDILDMCGKDATNIFRQAHGNDRRINAMLASYKIGTL